VFEGGCINVNRYISFIDDAKSLFYILFTLVGKEHISLCLPLF
jgi:hypothetical protein